MGQRRAWSDSFLPDVRGGILQGINATTGKEVDSQGGWLELGARPSKWFSVHAGYALVNPDNSDLAGANPPGRARNSIWYGAIRGYFDPIEVGMDYLNWTLTGSVMVLAWTTGSNGSSAIGSNLPIRSGKRD